MKKIKTFLSNNKIIWILFYFFIFSILIHNSFNYLDPDLGWHLRIGNDIFIEKSVPTYENYNYTLEDRSWVDHEWLINMLSYLIFDKFNYFYLNLFFVLIVISTLILLTIFTKKYFLPKQEGDTLTMLLQFFGVLAMSPHLGVRMQEITLLNLLILFVLLHKYATSKNYKFLFWIIPLLYLWSSLHAGFLIGLFVVFFFLGIKILENILLKIKFLSFIQFKNTLNYKEILTFTAFALLSLFSTFFTPYGLNLFHFLKGYTNTFYFSQILEWFPAWQWPIIYYQMIYLAISILTLFFIFAEIYKNHKNKIKIDLWNLSIFVFFLILAFKSRRHFPLFFVASFPLFIQFSNKHLEIPIKTKELIKNNLYIKTYLFSVFVITSSFFLLTSNFNTDPFINEKFCQEYPCESLKFINENPELKNLKILNDYNWGGFSIWVYPEKKIFIDGRLPQYEFEDHTLFQEYKKFSSKEDIEKMLEKHDIQLVHIKKPNDIKLNWFDSNLLGIKKERVSNTNNYLKDFLDSSQKWELIYTDNISEIYVKTQ